MGSLISWWAYLHVSGRIHVKRYIQEEDIEEARKSPFVKLVTDLFEARNKTEATKKAKEKFEIYG